MRRVMGLMVCLLFLASLLWGCSLYDYQPGEGLGGAALGGIAGAIIGHQSDETALGALAGAFVGKTIGDEVEKNKMKQGIAAANTRVVRVYSADGTFVEVVLRRHPSGWIVPQTGEVFSTEPTAEQLKARGYGPQ